MACRQSGATGQTDNRGQLSLRAGCPLRLGFWYIPCPKEVLRGMKPCYQWPRDELQTHGQLKSNSIRQVGCLASSNSTPLADDEIAKTAGTSQGPQKGQGTRLRK